MKKLKKKVFLVIFCILTLVTTGILIGYNAQLYNQEYSNVERNLNQTMMGFGKFGMLLPGGFDKNDEREDDLGNIRFIDSTVYTVLLSSDNSVYMVINHSGNDMSDEDIETLADAMITAGCGTKIGNLYTAQYSYKFEDANYITIVDNSSTNQFLRKTLLITLAIYLAFEVMILLLARLLLADCAPVLNLTAKKGDTFAAWAQWEPIPYTLSFDPSGGITQFDTKQIHTGEMFGVLPDASKEGYAFDGWFLQDGTAVSGDTVFTFAQDLTLYAHWTELQPQSEDPQPDPAQKGPFAFLDFFRRIFAWLRGLFAGLIPG